MRQHNDFLGTGWAFPPSFTKANQSPRLSQDEQDIQQSLMILLSTIPGERIMHPEYGCYLHRMVFEQLSPTTFTEIKTCIREAILFFESRIDLLKIDIQAEPQQGRLMINLTYRIITTNARGNMVYPFYLQEGTLIDPSLLSTD